MSNDANIPASYIPTTHELLYDPDEKLTDDKFREYYSDSGDLPISSFSDDDLAYQYASLYSRCIYDDDSMECIFCRRADH